MDPSGEPKSSLKHYCRGIEENEKSCLTCGFYMGWRRVGGKALLHYSLIPSKLSYVIMMHDMVNMFSVSYCLGSD